MLYLLLKHLHSGLRWVILLLLLLVIINSAKKLFASQAYNKKDQKFALFAMITGHTQLIIGLILYFISNKVVFSAESMSNTMLRFYLVEHISIMLIALVMITIGYRVSKKSLPDNTKHSRVILYYSLGLLLILISIPWPWRNLAGGWI